MSDIDHKVNAEGMMSASRDDGTVSGYQFEALVSATLFLAEQQRVANLIAYAVNHYPDARTATGDEIHCSIRDGLGLA